MINLKVRMKQKWFWLTLIPLLFLAFDQFAELIMSIIVLVQTYTPGSEIAGSAFEATAISFVGTAFAILALIGFPVDQTTNGYGDSTRALERTEPGLNASQEAVVLSETAKACVENTD